MEFDATQNKADSLAKKINDISKKFDIADEVCSEEIVEFVEEKTQDIVLHESQYDPIDVMTLTQMADDFKYSRDTLKETISNGRRVLQKATMNLLEADEESSAAMTIAFAELTSAVLSGIKVQSNLYKNFSSVLLDLKKLAEGETPQSTKSNITNNVTINTTEQISTVDLIARLKGE